MRRTLLSILLFLTLNLLLCWVHIAVFQSAWPFAAWATIGLHIVAIIFFPYTKLFHTK